MFDQKIITKFLSPNFVDNKFQKVVAKGLRTETNEDWIWLTVASLQPLQFDNSPEQQDSACGHQSWIHDSEGINSKNNKKKSHMGKV